MRFEAEEEEEDEEDEDDEDEDEDEEDEEDEDEPAPSLPACREYECSDSTTSTPSTLDPIVRHTPTPTVIHRHPGSSASKCVMLSGLTTIDTMSGM